MFLYNVLVFIVSQSHYNHFNASLCLGWVLCFDSAEEVIVSQAKTTVSFTREPGSARWRQGQQAA